MNPARRSSRLRQSTNIEDLVGDVDENIMLEDEDEELSDEEEDSGDSVYYDVDGTFELREEGVFVDNGEEDDEDEEFDPDYEEAEPSESSGGSDDEATALFAIVSNAFQIRLPRSVRPGRRRRRPRPGQEHLEPVPSQEGRELMQSGAFGYNDIQMSRKRKRKNSSGCSIKTPVSSAPASPSSPYRNDSWRRPPLATYRIRKPKQDIASRLLAREMGNYNDAGRISILNGFMAQSLIPSRLDKIIHFNARCYSGQFSEDGDFFYVCSQSMQVKMYNTENPYDWKYYKTEVYPGGRWTITDATLTPDNKWIAYSSIDSSVFMAGTQREEEVVEHLDFSYGARRYAMEPGTGIWSIRFSGDAREMVAGSNDNCLYVYDLELGKPTLKLRGHDNDVNAVCYGDVNSPHLLFSGSDDASIKIWDRRSLAQGREAGVLAGHLEGITYIDAKGDGRYVLSNSKDQTMKLWDIRKMMDRNTFESTRDRYHQSDFDYRFDTYDDVPIRRHPRDCSAVTFRGHSVLRTLIRCHFGGDRYVYTGSEDGRVHIYNLDATVAGVIDVSRETRNSKPKRRHFSNLNAAIFLRGGTEWGSCVRDVSWHPNAPLIAATAWSGYGHDGGTVTVHSWDGATTGTKSSTRDTLRAMAGANKGTVDRDEEETGGGRSNVKENWDDEENEQENVAVEPMDDPDPPEILDEELSHRLPSNYDP